LADDEKKAYASLEAKKSMALTEIDIYKTCRDELRYVNQFAHRDEIEFGDRIKDVQRRVRSKMLTTGTADNSTICVARPVDNSIDKSTGKLIAKRKCSGSVRGPETSICNEAAKMGLNVREKAGQVGKVLKRFYSDRYVVEASLNIPKRHTIFKGKPFEERTYYERDADLIQQAIRVACGQPLKPRQPTTTQTLLKFSPPTLAS